MRSCACRDSASRLICRCSSPSASRMERKWRLIAARSGGSSALSTAKVCSDGPLASEPKRGEEAADDEAQDSECPCDCSGCGAATVDLEDKELREDWLPPRLLLPLRSLSSCSGLSAMVAKAAWSSGGTRRSSSDASIPCRRQVTRCTMATNSWKDNRPSRSWSAQSQASLRASVLRPERAQSACVSEGSTKPSPSASVRRKSDAYFRKSRRLGAQLPSPCGAALGISGASQGEKPDALPELALA
mmetsp:Transcript_41634/g.90761  ORF Transcript_41634/g.90761 Transcript_41634/m.90761 type:complete len:245 (+) Transcript_41634:568-1302(+)